ncbi:MAG: C40 family peptidase [bacterium]
MPKPQPKYVGYPRSGKSDEKEANQDEEKSNNEISAESTSLIDEEPEAYGDRGAANEDADAIRVSEQNAYSLSTTTLAHRLAEELLPFVRSPYKFGGEDPSGVDCSGLIKVVYENAFDIKLPHKAALLFRMGRKVARNLLMSGDLVFFYHRSRRQINHVGLYLADDQFIHSSSSKGVVISNLNSKYWRKHYAGARRFILQE